MSTEHIPKEPRSPVFAAGQVIGHLQSSILNMSPRTHEPVVANGGSRDKIIGVEIDVVRRSLYETFHFLFEDGSEISIGVYTNNNTSPESIMSEIKDYLDLKKS